MPFLVARAVRTSRECQGWGRALSKGGLRSSHYDIAKRDVLLKCFENFWSGLTLPCADILAMAPLLEPLAIRSCKFFWLHLHSSYTHSSKLIPLFFEHTKGSLRNLHIGGVFKSSYHQQTMYGLCPRLETLAIIHANDESFKPLTVAGASEASNNTSIGQTRLLLGFVRHSGSMSWASPAISCVPLEALHNCKSSYPLRFRSLLGSNVSSRSCSSNS